MGAAQAAVAVCRTEARRALPPAVREARAARATLAARAGHWAAAEYRMAAESEGTGQLAPLAQRVGLGAPARAELAPPVARAAGPRAGVRLLRSRCVAKVRARRRVPCAVPGRGTHVRVPSRNAAGTATAALPTAHVVEAAPIAGAARTAKPAVRSTRIASAEWRWAELSRKQTTEPRGAPGALPPRLGTAGVRHHFGTPAPVPPWTAAP